MDRLPELSDAPLISVITVSYNQGEFIRQTIDSVLAQEYPNFEHIIVDGGSTDQTLDILRSYPHLKWTSEPDRGQTHALNKGFARATGDIIAWINSDDFYPPGVFREVAAKLRSHALVLGACQFVDREGKPTELVRNEGRNWFDILKYWIFHSCPAQPSIFFRRSALEAVRRADGSYLDEDLHFCMDYELWLRLAERYPFSHRSDAVLSCFRSYDTNKTGQDMAATYRECQRVFRRYANRAGGSECAISYIIPFREMSGQILATLESLTRQRSRDVELLLVDYSDDRKRGREFRSEITAADKRLSSIPIRYVNSYQGTYWGAVRKGVAASGAPLGAVLEPGTELDPAFTDEAVNLFSHAIIGLAFPSRGDAQLAHSLAKDDPNRAPGKVINIEAILSLPPFQSQFVFRKAALLELDQYRSSAASILALREMLLRLLYKGWHLNVDNHLSVVKAVGTPVFDREVWQLFDRYVNAQIFSNLSREQLADPFSGMRAQNGFSLVPPPELVAQAQAQLSQAPIDWSTLEYLDDPAKLEAMTREFPRFGPGWFFLARAQERAGDGVRAQAAMEQFRRLG